MIAEDSNRSTARALALEPGTSFHYSTISAHLAAAVLAAALDGADGAHHRRVLEYARTKLLDPLKSRHAQPGVARELYRNDGVWHGK